MIIAGNSGGHTKTGGGASNKPPKGAYNWLGGHIKRWDTNPPDSNFMVQQHKNDNGFGQWKGGSQLAPFSQNWNDGYDAVASDGRYHRDKKGNLVPFNTDTAAHMWERLLNQSNANFCNRKYYVPLFVNSINIDLGISGATAQGRSTRDFYPHNITIPSFTIQGQCYSTAHYGSLMEYIHMAQHQALNNTDLIQFYLAGTANTQAQGNRSDGLAVTYRQPNGRLVAEHLVQKIVGRHGRIICQGYINTITRTHEAGNHRPTWQAEFVVSNMLSSPIYTDGSVQEKETGTWLQVLHGVKANPTNSANWLDAFNEKNNKKTLATVKAGMNNILSSLGH